MPDIARRAHRERIDAVVKEALKRARLRIEDIDCFAVTYGPGLAIALEVGVEKAKELAQKYDKPLIPVNHLEGHLLSCFALNSTGTNVTPNPINDMPAIGLIVSGGHTELIYISKVGAYELIGETLDDAAGEAFDKVAKMLNLGYPGGPVITEFAKKGTSGKFTLPIPMDKSGDLNFSYSGLKTACLYKIRDIRTEHPRQKERDWVYDFCREFENSVIKSIILKLKKALEEKPVRHVFIGGGVISNTRLRHEIKKEMAKLGISVHSAFNNKHFTDNAAMIGVAASFRAKKKLWLTGMKIDTLEREPNAQL